MPLRQLQLVRSAGRLNLTWAGFTRFYHRLFKDLSDSPEGFPVSSAAHSAPEQGQLVSVRSRNWVVNDVRPSTLPALALKPVFGGPQHLLTLSSVEDDGLGEELQVIWEIEAGARVIEKVALPEPTGFDPPDKLDAFLDAPAVPAESPQVAVEKAEAGEEITVATAKEIVAEAKKRRRPIKNRLVLVPLWPLLD